MLVDVSGSSRDALRRSFDLCVVGGGPAGVTVARTAAGAGLSVGLMEGGGLDFSQASQDLYAGEVIGRDYFPLDATRLRYFGGTSNHWGGRCRPLEESDFKPHGFYPLSGWPISKADLDPYAKETDSILDLPSLEAEHTDNSLGEDLPPARFRMSPPTRFGTKYRAELESSQQITLAINANLVDLELDPALTTVTAARFRSYAPEDPGFTISAKFYCLCLGGMENPRFLLNSTRQFAAGIGNQYDLVGRFFTEHLGYNLGHVIFENGAPRGRSYQPSEAVKDANAILNFDLLVKAQRQGFAKELTRTVSCSSEFVERLSVAVLGRRVNCEHSSFGDFYALITSDDANTGSLGIIIEQALNRDSRILLSDELDAFGQRRIALDWRYSAMDAHTMQTAATLVAQEFAERGVGRVKLKDWLLTDDLAWPQLNDGQGEVALNHHMCTTRMSSDPRQGVVDADCRVHGVSNLYIGGSSVFATAGHANPTYTIVQLALRLGDHLGAQLHG